MSRPTSPDRCSTADTTKSEDPLDGKPSEDAKLTHVDSCSSLPDAGDDLVPCDRRNSTFTNQQLAGRKDELGNDTLIQLLANAATLLTSQDLALAPNDPRVFLPTPFAPGQSARTLLEQELRRKKQQEAKEWNALLQSKTTLSPQVAVSASKKPAVTVQPQSVTQTQMLMQNSPVVMPQQLQLGRGQPHAIAATGVSSSAAAAAAVGHQPFIQQQLQPQPLIQQQQHLLSLQQQLSAGGLLNPHQINPIQRMYASNAQSLAFQQPNINDVSIPALMGVGGMGLPQYTMVNNLMTGLVPGMTMPNNIASARALAASNRVDWLLQQQQFQQGQIPPVSTTHLQSHQTGETPKERAATKPATKQKEEKEKSDDDQPHPNRWTQRYNELLEYKRIEGVSCLDCYLLSLAL
jgi:hypothetical protein